MVGSGFVTWTHNTEIDMSISFWSRLTRYNRCHPLGQFATSSRTFVSQANVVASCTLPSIIIEPATTRLCRFGLVLHGQRVACHSNHFNRTIYFHVNGK